MAGVVRGTGLVRRQPGGLVHSHAGRAPERPLCRRFVRPHEVESTIDVRLETLPDTSHVARIPEYDWPDCDGLPHYGWLSRSRRRNGAPSY